MLRVGTAVERLGLLDIRVLTFRFTAARAMRARMAPPSDEPVLSFMSRSDTISSASFAYVPALYIA